MSDLNEQEVSAVKQMLNKGNEALDLSGGPSGSVKLPAPIGEREMIFNRPYLQDADLEKEINEVNRVIQMSRDGKQPKRDDLVSKRKSANKAVCMILGLTTEEVDTISHENQVGIIMHYRMRSQAESLSPLLGREDSD